MSMTQNPHKRIEKSVISRKA